MTWDLSSGPGITALGLAAARSVESGRPDRLIEDPFARALFEAAGADLPMLADWPDPGSPVSDAEALHLHGSRYIGLRTRFYDEALLAAARDGATQGVLLGAGLDTRAFRLDLPAGFQLFELDQPAVFEFKDATLDAQGAEPRCIRTAIGIDLRDDWPAALEAGGLAPEQPTAWVAEGLLAYLPPDAQEGLLSGLHGLAAPGSVVALDRIAGDPAAGERLRALSERSGIDMESLLARGDGDDLAVSLRTKGWEVDEQPTTTLADRYGRDLSDPFAGAPHSSFRAPEPPWLDTIFLTAGLLAQSSQSRR
ncbi:MAG: SAM-dependent methyltransferase [Thermoleophilaceae bacterium]